MKKRQIPLSCGAPGTETVLTAFEYGPQQAPRKVYIQASLHADELPGSLVAWQLCQQLQELEAQQRISSQIVVVPLCNPLGLRQSVMYSQIGRFDLATGQNYNRLRGIDFFANKAQGTPACGGMEPHAAGDGGGHAHCGGSRYST